MKLYNPRSYLFSSAVFLFLLMNSLFLTAQENQKKELNNTINAAPLSITFDDDRWERIGDVDVLLHFDDEDNGDGSNDGAIYVSGERAHLVTGLGVSFTFGGHMTTGEVYNLQTIIYNSETSFFRLRVQLYNLTDDVLLAESSKISITGGVTTPETIDLAYTAQASDNNDTLQLRYVRADDGHRARKFSVDTATMNGATLSSFDQIFLPGPILDIPLVSSNATLKAEMDAIENLLENDYLVSAPSAQELTDAVAAYNALNIVVSNGKITGNAHTARGEWSKASFLKVFARHLKYNPSDSGIQEKASNTVWLFADQLYKGTLSYDYITYAYKLYAKPALYLKPFLSANIQKLFEYTLYKHSLKYAFFWNKDYIIGIAGTHTGAINLDDIGNISDIQLTFCLKWQTSEDERLRWAKGFKRFYERFLSYSPGTACGIKVDGSAFHHFSALNNYTYNFNTPMTILSFLKGTSFQVSKESYRVLRKGVYTQYFVANDNVEPLSMSGRHPDVRRMSPSKTVIKEFIKTGGAILNIGSFDPILAGAYVRHWGADADFPNQVAEKLDGFTQFNYHTGGVYWKNNWMAVARGFTRWGFGAEMIRGNTNVYGRYQSYGALEIIYSGGEVAGNGFVVDGWNYNYNPGATSIVLPWEKLRSENLNQKEYQTKNFAGSLAFENKNDAVYAKTTGEFGMFAMDFKETGAPHGSTPQGAITHNATFGFKKSKFFFSGMIVSLGSQISNNDASHKTVTTLFQRYAGTQAQVIADDTSYTSYSTTSLATNSQHWLIDNFSTGFYLPGLNDVIRFQRERQQVPYEDQYDPALRSGNLLVDYNIGFIDHGVTPSNKGYEYLTIPKATTDRMKDIATKMSSLSTRLYTVHQKDENAHVLEYHAEKIMAYAFFNQVNDLAMEGLLKSASQQCLVMTKPVGSEGNRRLSISHPDMGIEKKNSSTLRMFRLH